MAENENQADTRRAALLKIADGSPAAEQLVEEMLFLEAQLTELKGLPMIRRNPNNPKQAKPTPTAKLYKELLQQYVNIVKAVEKISGAEAEEASPLREYLSRMRRE